jgi:hypothetical protein
MKEDEMQKYYIRFSNGFEETFLAKSDRAAKCYATKRLTFESGAVCLSKIDVDDKKTPIAWRDFWQNLNNFGWDKWV